MTFEPDAIDDPHDPRLADYRDVRERDLVGRRGLFVAEGLIVLRALVRSQAFEPVSILVSQAKAPGLGAVLAERPTSAPVHVASQAVMDSVVGFQIHRGVLAIGRRREVAQTVTDLLASLPKQATVLAAFGIGNHDNIGALFRNAAAFGVDALLFDGRCCDPLYRKALRVSVGAALLTPWARTENEREVVDALESHGFQLLALSPSGAATFAELSPRARSALLVGAEGPGLPQAVLGRARSVRIPMAEGFDSLNVATAAAVALSWLSAPHQARGSR